MASRNPFLQPNKAIRSRLTQMLDAFASLRAHDRRSVRSTARTAIATFQSLARCFEVRDATFYRLLSDRSRSIADVLNAKLGHVLRRIHRLELRLEVIESVEGVLLQDDVDDGYRDMAMVMSIVFDAMDFEERYVFAELVRYCETELVERATPVSLLDESFHAVADRLPSAVAFSSN